MVSNIFYVHLGTWSNLTNFFQLGWNHQPENVAGLLPWFAHASTVWCDRSEVHLRFQSNEPLARTRCFESYSCYRQTPCLPGGTLHVKICFRTAPQDPDNFAADKINIDELFMFNALISWFPKKSPHLEKKCTSAANHVSFGRTYCWWFRNLAPPQMYKTL